MCQNLTILLEMVYIIYMNTVRISRIEYLNILKTQKELSFKVAAIESIISDSFLDEVSQKYAMKLERISTEMDKGKGKRFSNVQDMKKYLRAL